MLEQLTPTEYNRELTQRAIKAVRHLASTMNECYALFWDRESQVIIDSMNANLALTLERFGANSVIGYAVNSQLANTDIDTRVIVAMPTGYSFNGTEFIYTAPIVESLAPIENEV